MNGTYQKPNVKNYDSVNGTDQHHNHGDSSLNVNGNKYLGWKRLAIVTLVACGVAFAGYVAGRSSIPDRNLDIEGLPAVGTIASLKASSTVENLENGAVAADDIRCSEVGASILRDHGGNAIDAAVATTLCLQVINPSGSTMGGGAFMLIHANVNDETEAKSKPFNDKRQGKPYKDKNGKVTEVIDCRETAPEASTWDMFENLPSEASWNGGLASATPGQLRGLELAHSRHGKLSWSQVVEPAMHLAEKGVTVTPYLAHAINLKSSKAKIFKHEHLRNLLTKDHNGEDLLQDGDILTQPQLAKTFRAVMEGGADAIYEGDLAEKIAQDIQNAGGIITTEDLSNYRPSIHDPLVAHDVGGFTMVGVPPPSSGGAVVIGAARFLAGYEEDFSSFEDTLSQHRLVEAMKHAYAIRMSLSDPEYNSEVVADAVADLIKGSYMAQLRNATQDDDVLHMSGYGGDKWGILNDGDIAGGDLQVTEEGHDNRRNLRGSDEDASRNLRLFQYLEDHGTTHISIIDKDGNAVTMTTTINTYFGSGVVSPSTGIIFNSQMDDFASPGGPNHYGMEPSVANYIAPGKKPLSSISPTFVFRRNKQEKKDKRNLGKLVLALGASGGPKIPTAVLQVFLNHILLGMPLYDAVVAPRLHDQLLYKGYSATLYDECPLLQGPTIQVTDRTRGALSSRGHDLFPVSNTGSAQGVSIDQETGLLTAVSDIRKGGCAAGY